MGKATEEWSFGDLDAGFKSAALVVDETFVVQSTGHHPLETRSAMAYWQNGKLYLHCSTQSVVRTVDARRALGRHRAVETSCSISEYTRRRVRQQGRRRRVDGHPGAAVEEGERAGDDAHQPRGGELHRPRAHQHGGPRQDRLPRRTAASPRSISSSSRTTARTDRWAITARPATRRRSSSSRRRCAGAPSTCSPTRRRARSSDRPARCRPTASSKPVMTKAAKQLGLDQVAIRRINSPEGKALYGPPAAQRPAPAHHRARS